jgi:hypothetical protein
MSKSKILKRLARRRGIKFVDVPMSMLNPEDLRGFPTVDPEMQSAAMKMVADRTIGEHKLGDSK